MRIRCIPLLGDQVYPAELRDIPSMISRAATDVVLVVYAGVDVELSPPGPDGCELIEASAQELASLKDAGFDLPWAESGET